MFAVELDGVTVRRGRVVALERVSFAAEPGELVVLVGSSGSGKTSVLRAIAGLDDLVAGAVRIDGRDVTTAPPGARDVAMTFQEPGLLLHRSVARNIGFPLEVRNATADAVVERVGVEARALEIEHLLGRDVGSLSVGEVQMVQVARALVRTPALLLLDEPFAAVERERGVVLRREVQLLQRRFGVTTILSTNDPAEAMAMADRVVVLDRGRVVQVGPPVEVYERPDTTMAAMLLGDAAIHRVEIEADAVGSWIVHPAFRVRAWAPALRAVAGRRFQLLTRPGWWEVDERGTIHATVERVWPTNGGRTLACDVGGHRLHVELPWSLGSSVEIVPGSAVGLRLAKWVLIDPRDGRRVDLGA